MLNEEKLSSKKHFRSVGDFCCGPDSPLDTFLSGQAFKYDEQRYGITYILTASTNEDKILGFYTLKTSGIQIEEDGEYNSIPVIEIARIAMNYSIQGKEIGFYTSVGFKKASDEVQKEIEDSFNEKCDLYMVSFENIEI